MIDSDLERNGFTIIQGEKPLTTYACTMRKAIRNFVETFGCERTLNIYIMFLERRTIKYMARKENCTPQTVRYHLKKVQKIFPNMRPWI